MAQILNKRIDALRNLYNNMLQDLVSTEFNIKILTREQIMVSVIPPGLEENLMQMKTQAQKIKGSLVIILEMIAEEEKRIDAVKEAN